MKIYPYLFALLLFAAFNSCQKKNNKSAEIVRDCTGTYLRIDTKDYLVCNDEITATYPENGRVIATFKIVDECSQDDGIVCELYHPYEEKIEITKIESE